MEEANVCRRLSDKAPWSTPEKMTRDAAIRFAEESLRETNLKRAAVGDNGRGYGVVVASPVPRWKKTKGMGEWFKQFHDQPDPFFVATRRGQDIEGDGPWAPKSWIPCGKRLEAFLRDSLGGARMSVTALKEFMLTCGYSKAPSPAKVRAALVSMGCTFEETKAGVKWSLPVKG